MNFGINLSTFNDFADPNLLADIGQEIEEAGWESVFLWDHLMHKKERQSKIVSPWIALSAIATRTSRIKIGTYVSPLPRYQPWEFAKLTASLDLLSNGRLILGLGLGSPADEYTAFGKEYNTRILAEMMDEGLVIIQKLWIGEPFTFHGKHYQLEEAFLLPRPVQYPRVPILLGGFWPRKKPFIRAAKFDGIVPITKKYPQPISTEELRDLLTFINQYRTSSEPFQVTISGSLPTDPEQRDRLILGLTNAGATRWIEHCTPWTGSIQNLLEKIRRGPPTIQQ